MKKKKIGLFTSAWDEIAWELINMVCSQIALGIIPNTEVAFVFSSRERGEHEVSDRLIENCIKLRVPVIAYSAARFKAEFLKAGKSDWRQAYEEALLKMLPKTEFDFQLGYMLIVGKDMCEARNMINLHPAVPGGHQGTFIDVIWELIRENATESGVMIHHVIPKLDSGPAISFCRYPIGGKRVNRLREEMQSRLMKESFEDIKKKERESNPLFRIIRELGVRREFPLITATLKGIAEGTIQLPKGDQINFKGIDLTKEVEKRL